MVSGSLFTDHNANRLNHFQVDALIPWVFWFKQIWRFSAQVVDNCLLGCLDDFVPNHSVLVLHPHTQQNVPCLRDDL